MGENEMTLTAPPANPRRDSARPLRCPTAVNRVAAALVAALCANGLLTTPSWATDSGFDTPPRFADFLHLKLELTFAPQDIRTGTLHGIATWRVRPRTADQAGSDTYDGQLTRLDLEAVDLDIHSVELAEKPADGVPQEWRPATHQTEEGQLRIALDPPRTHNDEFFVRIRYQTVGRVRGIYFVRPDARRPDRPTMIYSHAEGLQARNWMPCHDWPDTRWPSDVFITVPEPYSAVSVGQPVGQPLAAASVADAKMRTFHWRITQPIDPHMFGFAVGEFITLRDEWRGRPVLVYTHPRYEKGARYTFRRTADMLEYYSKLTGVQYPYPQFAHVAVVNHFHGGMENVGFDMLNPSMFAESDAADVPPDRSEFNYIAHMLAHQWFGALVNYRRMTEAWLNEGFATYFHQMWRSQAYAYDDWEKNGPLHGPTNDWFIDAMWTTARGIARSDRAGRGRPIVNERIRNPDAIYQFDGGKIYWKGAWVLHMLRHQLGDDAFFKGVKLYLERNRDLSLPNGGSVVTSDLRAAFETIAERELKAFFDQWVYRGGIPELEITYDWDADLGQTHVRVSQTQKIDEKNPVFEFPLDLYFQNGDQHVASTVTVSEQTQTFDLKFDRAPTLFCVDPRGGLLKSIESQSKPLEMWIEQARRGPTTLARSIAIRRLGRRDRPGVVACLSECLNDQELFWGARRYAASGLSSIGGDEALEALLAVERRGEPHPRVLAAVMRAIGSFEDSTSATEALLRQAGPQAHMFVRRAALAQLRNAEFSAEIAESAAASLLSLSRDERARVRRVAVETLGRLRVNSTLPRLKELAESDPDKSVRDAAAKAVAQIDASNDPDER